MHLYVRRLLESASGAIVAESPLIAAIAESSYALASNETNSTASPSDPNNYGYMDARFTPSMAIIVIVLLSAFFFMAIFSIYMRRCISEDEFNAVVRGRPRPGQGLDRAMVESLPMINYQTETVKEDNDSSGCVVCLTDFEDGEPLRLLPKCQHCFHPACIDLWLNSHTTCPVCRHSLLPDKDKEKSNQTDSNRGLTTRNEENARGDLTVDTQISGDIAGRLEVSCPEVAVNIRDGGTEQGGTVLEMSHKEENLSIAQSSATGESRLNGKEASWRLRDSPIHGVMSPSPSPFQGRDISRRTELRRANSTGHSRVKRAFNRANCLLPAESDDLGRPQNSCLPLATSAVGGMHRSKSQTTLPLALINSNEVGGDSNVQSTRRDAVLGGWRNFSFKRAFSLKRSPDQGSAATVGESPTTSQDI